MESTEINLGKQVKDITLRIGSQEQALTAKEKKPRSEAQINATKRALEALQAKRKQQWEKKKEELADCKPQATFGKPLSKELVESAPIHDIAPTPIIAPVAPVSQDKPAPKKYNKKQVPSSIPMESKPVKEEMPEWAKVMYDKLDKLSNKTQKKKKVIIEESDSDSSDEEIVVRKKKTLPPPPPPTPVIESKPVNPLRQLLNRR